MSVDLFANQRYGENVPRSKLLFVLSVGKDSEVSSDMADWLAGNPPSGEKTPGKQGF